MNDSPPMLDVLIVAQTPPPYHGQAIMMDSLVKGRFTRLRMHHVRMAFSREIDDIGRFEWSKILHLLAVIVRIYRARLAHPIKILYYPPGGTSAAPLYRDIVVLLACRWLFAHTVYHIHAGGLSELVAAQPAWIKFLYLRVCGRPDCVIKLSGLGPLDGRYLKAKNVVVVPNAVADYYPAFRADPPAPREVPRLLFVGALRLSKGVLVLLEACARLRERGLRFELHCMGTFESQEFESECRAYVSAHALSDRVRFLGPLAGDDKWRVFAGADVLCLPTFYEAEGMPLVILEAMQFALPVVATRWRGIPDLVQDGATGLLVAPQDTAALVEALARLLSDAGQRRAMGEKARQRYLEEFTLDRWRARIEQAVLDVAGIGRDQ